MNWGRNPLRSLNGWLEYPGFVEFVEKWKALEIVGVISFVKEKFKLLKESLRRWNIEFFGWIDVRVKNVIKQINVCDDKFVTIYGEEGAFGLLNTNVEGTTISVDKAEASRSFWNNLQRRECLLKHKS